MPSRPGCCELGHGNSSGLGFMIQGPDKERERGGGVVLLAHIPSG